jgi:DNA-binding MarR family transcriptional regulator
MGNVDKEALERSRESKRTDPDINLYMLLRQTDKIIYNAVDTELKHLRVTQSQITILTILSRENKPVTLDELANWSLRDFSSVFTLVGRMEKKGLVKRIKQNGESKTFITITDKGSQLYHQKVTEQSIHLVFDDLSADEKKQLDITSRKLRDRTRDLLGLDFRPPFL